MSLLAQLPAAPLAVSSVPILWVQFIALSAIPIGMTLLMQKTRAFKWTDLLRSTGILVVPLVLVLTINDVLAPMASTLLIGLVMAYAIAMIDTD